MKKYIVILLSIIGILNFSDVKASVEPELIAQLTGSANLVNNATLVVYDDIFLTSTGSDASPSPSQSSYHLKRTLNTITLKINSPSTFPSPPKHFVILGLLKQGRRCRL